MDKHIRSTPNYIPVAPKHPIRVCVPIERAVYMRAKQLNIDLQTLCRLTIEQSVETLENKQSKEKNLHDQSPEETEGAFLDAVARFHNQQNEPESRGFDSKNTKGIEGSVKKKSGQ